MGKNVILLIVHAVIWQIAFAASKADAPLLVWLLISLGLCLIPALIYAIAYLVGYVSMNFVSSNPSKKLHSNVSFFCQIGLILLVQYFVWAPRLFKPSYEEANYHNASDPMTGTIYRMRTTDTSFNNMKGVLYMANVLNSNKQKIKSAALKPEDTLYDVDYVLIKPVDTVCNNTKIDADVLFIYTFRVSERQYFAEYICNADTNIEIYRQSFEKAGEKIQNMKADAKHSYDLGKYFDNIKADSSN